MIKVFGHTDRVYTSNGDVVIKPLKAKIRKEDNGDFYLDLEAGLEYVNYLVEGNILVAHTPQGDQPFRITNPVKTKSKITVKAWHVFYDSKNYLIADSYVVDKTCPVALDHLNKATEPVSVFQVDSNVGTVNSYRCVRKSLYEAIQTVIEKWGGHLVRDGFRIDIKAQIGQDNGITVQYKKNLKDITCEEKWDNVVTKLMPVGRDGLLLNAVDSSASLYVTSKIQYDLPYTKAVSFQQELNQEDYPSETEYKKALVADLKKQALAYVELHSKPEVNYTLKANLEKVTDVGDIIEVKDDRLGINLMTNVIAYDYDCILNRYTEIEFGNFKPTLSGLVGNITASVNKDTDDKINVLGTTLQDDINDIREGIIGTMTDSYVIYNGDRIMVVDSLPKESAVNVIRIDSTGLWFSQDGIYGDFRLVWSIENTLNMQEVNVIGLVLDKITGGTLKLGGTHGIIEIYDASDNLIGQIDSDGFKIISESRTINLGYETASCSTTWQGTAVVKRQGNVVCLSASMHPASNVTLETTSVMVCTVPEGYRPSDQVRVLCQGSDMTVFYCTIEKSGAVRISKLRDNSGYVQGTPAMQFPVSATWII